MRRWKLVVFILGLASLQTVGVAAGAPVFGIVVPIGGSASDIALDESRGVLYIADFGGSAIDVMSTADNSLRPSIRVKSWPGAIALSLDSQYLLVAHYCNGQTSPACANAITSVHLSDSSQQVFPLADPPLAVAFLATGQAMVVTTANILLIDPASGTTQLVESIANLALALPVPMPTFPGQILQAALAASADGKTIWAIASAGTTSQLIFQYIAATNSFIASIYTSTPTLLPRISSAANGSYAMIGYALFGGGGILNGRYPAAIASTNITGSAVDSANNKIYAQFPDTNQPGGPPTSISGTATAPKGPAMLILDSDNLTFRDRISIPEDMVGRAVLNAAASIMYAVSESGVMVLPVGALNTYHRLTATQEDILVATNFCNTGVLTQNLTITDPGGGHTDFAVSTDQPGVTIVPASGTTPARVQVLVDPTAVPGAGGTEAVTITLTSRTAVNLPRPVRLLVNNPDPSQRGTIIDQPGVLSDILPDPARKRIYVLRQDMNQLQIFDGRSLSLIGTLRTATSPTMMAIANGGKYLLVGHDDSQLIKVFDLDTMKAVAPVFMPGGHFARSIAVSGVTILVLARYEGLVSACPAPAGMIDTIIDLKAGVAAPLPTLGAFENCVSPTGVLAASPSGANILYASPDGTVALYTAPANTFVNSRHDFPSFSGAFAASDIGANILGNNILNSSLVFEGVVNPSSLPTSGFQFAGQSGYMASAASPSAPGFLLHVSLQPYVLDPVVTAASPVSIVEAPLLPTAATEISGATIFGTDGSGSSGTYAQNSFTRTIAPMASSGMFVLLSTSGLTVLASDYSAGVIPPVITAITSAADGTVPVAPGELISIWGKNLSQVSLIAGNTPLATSLGNSCLGVNGSPIPLLYVSPQQINAQLPFDANGNESLAIHTPEGVSNNFLFFVVPTAPSVFRNGAAGTEMGLATVVRDDNNQFVTPTNPIHPKNVVTIYLTGMGQTTPEIVAGVAAPSNPFALAAVQPVVTLGGTPLSVSYAGLTPGEVGVYQINATVPFKGVPNGLAIPLVISQGGITTTVNVRVVN